LGLRTLIFTTIQPFSWLIFQKFASILESSVAYKLQKAAFEGETGTSSLLRPKKLTFRLAHLRVDGRNAVPTPRMPGIWTVNGASTSGLVSEEPPGRSGNGWRGLSGLDSGSVV